MRLSLPAPGLDEQLRRVFIPNNTANLDEGGQWYEVDMRPLLTFDEERLDIVIATAPGYFFTVQYWSDKTDQMLKTVQACLIDKKMRASDRSKTDVKELVLPRETDYAFWADQAAWLRSARNVLEKAIIPLCQTLSANRRPGQASAFHRIPQ